VFFVSWVFLLVIAIQYVIYLLFFRVQARTLEQVIDMARIVQSQYLRIILDPKYEEQLRGNLSTGDWREMERLGLSSAVEYLRRMGFNTLLILTWANAEKEQIEKDAYKYGTRDDERERFIDQVIDAGVKFRFYYLCTMARLLLRIVFIRFLPVKGSTVTKVFNIEGLAAYRDVLNAARGLSAYYGASLQDRFVTVFSF
jgi:hypothetical protein